MRNVGNGRFSMCPHLAWAKRGVAPIGNVRIWKTNKGHQFKVIKLETGFVHYAPWLWKQHYGPIPEGMCIRTKDDSLNITIDNLEMITRAEHQLRNSALRSNLPPEIREIKQLLHKLNTKIKNHESSN